MHKELIEGGPAYSRFVTGLFSLVGSRENGIMHAAAGIAGEGGEVLDCAKKHWAYGQELNRENMIEELGDLEFYMEAMRQLIEVSRVEVIQANMAKLSKRYPEGKFTQEAATVRADKA
jgi:NTP pyrophosphatase (non-canonical NTP hydrolase)